MILTTNNARTSPNAPRIVVAGGGIAGAEAALTIALGLPDANVTLVGRWPTLRVKPSLVYVPFGVAAGASTDLPLTELHPHGVQTKVAEIESVDAQNARLNTNVGDIKYDVLIAAPGAVPRGSSSGLELRTLEDATTIEKELATIIQAAKKGQRRSITITSGAEDSWSAPAVELSLLTGALIRALGLSNRVETTLITPDSEAFPWFGPKGSQIVDSALKRARVKVLTSLPKGRINEIEGHLNVNIGSLTARTIPGLPGHEKTGWYSVSPTFAVAKNIHVIGDAIDQPWRAGFATAWQARRVLRALGGDPARLGMLVDGVRRDSVEYQLDLADSVLRARIDEPVSLTHPFLGRDAEVAMLPGQRPDKLHGLLIHERILRWWLGGAVSDAPLAFRDLLRSGEVVA